MWEVMYHVEYKNHKEPILQWVFSESGTAACALQFERIRRTWTEEKMHVSGAYRTDTVGSSTIMLPTLISYKPFLLLLLLPAAAHRDADHDREVSDSWG